MTDPTIPPVPPVTEPSTKAPMSVRRRIVVIAVAIVAGIAAFIGVQAGLNALSSSTSAPQTEVVQEAEEVDDEVEDARAYTSPAESYSVVAPGEPTVEQEELVGAITTTATRWTDGDRYYSVSSTDGQDLPPSQRGFFLQAVLTAALAKAPGVSASSLQTSAVTDAFLATPEQFTISGDPAALVTITLDGAPAPFDVVFAGHAGTLYMLVFSDSADSGDEDFLDSFAFVD